MTAGQARAVIVTVGGQDWDVTKFLDYGAGGLFQTPANGGVMPWWGSASLAAEFATKLNSQLGNPGPNFGYEFAGFSGINAYSFINSTLYAFEQTTEDTRDWAQATLVPSSPPSSVPGPLPALGAAAAFGFSRKLRKRIKNSANIASVSYSL